MADENRETFEKLNDYTLSVRTDFSHQAQSDPMLRRIFNFRAQQVTEIYSTWYRDGISTSMVQSRFSDLDSRDEVELMRGKLRELGGNPPENNAPRSLPGKDFRP